jgi:hypothetical protein
MESDDVARAVLDELGLSVRKLPEVSALGKRADFIAKLDQFSLLVEAKAYIPDHDAPRPSKERKDFERMFSMADPMLRHLEKKYGVPPFTFSQGHFNKPILIQRRS